MISEEAQDAGTGEPSAGNDMSLFRFKVPRRPFLPKEQALGDRVPPPRIDEH